MNIRYTHSAEGISWESVSGIFAEIGWGERSPQVIEYAFGRSSFVRFAYFDDELVGVGRTVDDGCYYGWIVDLAVSPKYQGLGVGTKILNDLEADLRPFITTMLTAAPGKAGFYERLGWCKQKSAYIYPRSEEQKRAFSEHC